MNGEPLRSIGVPVRDREREARNGNIGPNLDEYRIRAAGWQVNVAVEYQDHSVGTFGVGLQECPAFVDGLLVVIALQPRENAFSTGRLVAKYWDEGLSSGHAQYSVSRKEPHEEEGLPELT